MALERLQRRVPVFLSFRLLFYLSGNAPLKLFPNDTLLRGEDKG